MSNEREHGAMIAAPDVGHRTLDLPHGGLHYVEAGRGDPIVLLHGGHGSWTHWIANVGPLSASLRVLAPDLPGFGDSFAPDPGYTIDEYAQTVAQMIERLGLERVTLAGFSFGCVVATAAAALAAERVTRLVLVNAPATGARNPEVDRIQRELSRLARESGLKAGVIGSLRELQLYDHARIDDEVIALMMQNVRRTRRITKDISNERPLQERLARVRQPLLVLIGRDDHHQYYRLEERCAGIQAAAPQARIERVERCRHWLAFDRADAFNSLVLEFVSG
ncbi:MAG TPA: alpha/beta hydrolase [Burkholderiales bacterium]|nr:alpha/beta hydrolase [Burkholderiales bacterium]